MGEELARIVNEARGWAGPPLSQWLRWDGEMQCEDFEWFGQAIEINREVGGDLAGVLDHVAETVRERAQIKGQVQGVGAAEGKFSAYILVALALPCRSIPQLLNPGYMNVLTQSPLAGSSLQRA